MLESSYKYRHIYFEHMAEGIDLTINSSGWYKIRNINQIDHEESLIDNLWPLVEIQCYQAKNSVCMLSSIWVYFDVKSGKITINLTDGWVTTGYIHISHNYKLELERNIDEAMRRLINV